MLLGGVPAFTGRVDVVVMMVCAALGAIVGDSVGYELGRRFGGPLRRSRLARRIGLQRWNRAEEYVATWPGIHTGGSNASQDAAACCSPPGSSWSPSRPWAPAG
jgi:hypothetical protein